MASQAMEMPDLAIPSMVALLKEKVCSIRRIYTT